MKRQTNIDLLRVICALAVVGIHAITNPVGNRIGTIDANLIMVLNCIHNLLNWSVPVFFMITGYCIFRKQAYSYRNCVSHISKFVAVLLTVGFAYAVLEEVSTAGTVNLQVLIHSLKNVISGNLWDHMWYVYDIIGIYLVLPVLHPFMQSGKKNRLILTGLLFFFGVVGPALSPWVNLGIHFPFGGYLCYVCMGGMIAKNDFGRLEKIIFVLSGVVCAVYIACSREFWGYHSLPVCLMAVCIFVMITGLNVKAKAHILTLSQCTWGVYLLHPLFINIVVKVLKIDLVSSMACVKLPVFYFGICLISFAVVYVLRKIPLIKKLF
jgi:surface polysaccharide O-acyltransferase-like enzyme